ncbi:LppA family lipoprotein [Antrihabitans spumae]|uniref:LppA family lipoprotein n=1 Tax=Antrihabitans spumae TaxID=3373370 RepID=A0ABW7K6I7_9NOCA
MRQERIGERRGAAQKQDRGTALAAVVGGDRTARERNSRGIAEAATALVPSLIWRPNRERSQYSCASEYEDTGSRWVSTPHTVSDVPIPNADWPKVLQAARDIAREAGITEVQVLSDVPGNRNVRLYGNDGNTITIGSLKASVISADTGCRLPAADLAQPPS